MAAVAGRRKRARCTPGPRRPAEGEEAESPRCGGSRPQSPREKGETLLGAVIGGYGRGPVRTTHWMSITGRPGVGDMITTLGRAPFSTRLGSARRTWRMEPGRRRRLIIFFFAVEHSDAFFICDKLATALAGPGGTVW